VIVVFGVLTFWVGRYDKKHLYRPEKESFIPHGERGGESGRDFEMSEVPFGARKKTYVQTPRTPFFTTGKKVKKWGERLEDRRAERKMEMSGRKGTAESLYADTPAEERESPFKGKWEGVDLR
jgi:hypothetical protein